MSEVRIFPRVSVDTVSEHCSGIAVLEFSVLQDLLHCWCQLTLPFKKYIAKQFGHAPVAEVAEGRQTTTRQVW